LERTASDYSDHIEKQALAVWASDIRVRLWIDGAEVEIPLPGRWRKSTVENSPPVPGDLFGVIRADGAWRIERRLPRRNHFTRKAAGKEPLPQTIAANLDQALFIASATQPATPFGLIDRLLAVAALGDVPAILVLNKIDLVESGTIEEWTSNFSAAFAEIAPISVVAGTGLGRVKELLAGKLTLLAGSSGVGKSSLLNAINPTSNQKTGLVSHQTGKGKHITSSARMFRIPGDGWVVDTPGMRECAPWGLSSSNIIDAFPELGEIEGVCRYRDCRHLGEEGCAIAEPANSGIIPAGRYESYRRLLEELLLAERRW